MRCTINRDGKAVYENVHVTFRDDQGSFVTPTTDPNGTKMAGGDRIEIVCRDFTKHAAEVTHRRKEQGGTSTEIQFKLVQADGSPAGA